jgi:hypothetical protein
MAAAKRLKNEDQKLLSCALLMRLQFMILYGAPFQLLFSFKLLGLSSDHMQPSIVSVAAVPLERNVCLFGSLARRGDSPAHPTVCKSATNNGSRVSSPKIITHCLTNLTYYVISIIKFYKRQQCTAKLRVTNCAPNTLIFIQQPLI